MGVKLYSYQKKALENLESGSVLVGGVGSGKSITSLAYFYKKICNGEYTRLEIPKNPIDLYIITTARKRDTLEWNAEFAKFGLATDSRFSVGNIKVTVDSWNNIKKYVDVKDAFFIFDEQRVVGSGEWVKAFLKITKHNKWILLSATPGDTWIDYLPIFIANGYYRNRSDFYQQHVVFDRFAKYPKILRYVNTGKLEKIRQRIVVIMENFSPNTRHVDNLQVNYDRDVYDIAFNDRWNPNENEPIQDAGQLCYILRKIVNTDPSRLDMVVRLSKRHDRIIIFYNLDCELDQLRSLPSCPDFSADISIAEWNGHKHELIPKTKKWVYLVQYSAGSEGWNCRETDTMIFYSLNYSYKIMEQASGRIDRVNNIYHDLYYYRLVSNSTIDKAILKALSQKRTFNEKMFLRT